MEQDFIKRSIDQEEQERHEEEERRKRELAQAQALAKEKIRAAERLFIGALVAVILAGIAFLVMIVAIAIKQAHRAEQQARISLSQKLAVQADQNLDIQPDLVI